MWTVISPSNSNNNSIYLTENSNFYNLIKNKSNYENDIKKYDIFYKIFSRNFFNNITTMWNDLKNYFMYIKKLIWSEKKKLLNNINNTKNFIQYNNREYFSLSPIKNFANFLIKKVELMIGNNIIEWFDCDFINIVNELLTKENQKKNTEILINNDFLNNNVFFVNLPFWFTLDSSNALPIVIMKYNDIIINIELNDLHDCLYFDDNVNNDNYIDLNNLIIPKINLYVQYYYIDEIEIKSFTNYSWIERIIFQWCVICETVKLWELVESKKISLNLNFSGSWFMIFMCCKPSFMDNIFKLKNYYSDVICYNIVSINKMNNDKIEIFINNHCLDVNDEIKIYGTHYYNKKYIIKEKTENWIIVKSNFFYNETGILFLSKNDDIVLNNNLIGFSLNFQNFKLFDYDNIELKHVREYLFFENW